MSETTGEAAHGAREASGHLRFDGFDLDLEACKLLRDGRPVKLQQQPCRVLAVLASRAGELVTRQEIRKAIWGADTWVNFDQGLNFCIKEVRAALGDRADKPRYIETLQRRGYRFIATTSPVSPVRKKLAVLPFDDLGHGQDGSCEKLADQLVSELVRARPEQLSVIARRSTRSFRSGDEIGLIGRVLGADFIVEGVVTRSDDGLTISARLIRVADQIEAWTGTFERGPGERATLELARRIARGITSSLLKGG